MSHFESPFLAVSAGDWLCSNDSTFVICDGFSVSSGHVLVTTRGIFETWFDASDGEQAHAAILQLRAIRRALDQADSIRHKPQKFLRLSDGFLRSVFPDIFRSPLVPRAVKAKPKASSTNKFYHIDRLKKFSLDTPNP